MLCETSLVCPPRSIHSADYDSFALSCATTDAGSIRRNDMMVLDCWESKNGSSQWAAN
jgi:hypothetical protein